METSFSEVPADRWCKSPTYPWFTVSKPAILWDVIRWAVILSAVILWAVKRWAVIRWAVIRWAVIRWAVIRWAVIRWDVLCMIRWYESRITRRKTSSQRKLSIKHSRRIFSVKGSIYGRRVSALPDTGAECNMMSASYARRSKFLIRSGPRSRQSFQLANGKTVRTKGMAFVHWTFEDRPDEPYMLVFHLLPDCAHSIILGNAFLAETETLTRNRHRIQVETVHGQGIQHVNVAGSLNQRLIGCLDGMETLALPDTGSEVHIVSEAYARKRGFDINTNHEHRNILRLANGSVQETVGQIEADWTCGEGGGGGSKTLTFEVLAGCPYEVIIGQGLLFDDDVFLTPADWLVEDPSSNAEENSDAKAQKLPLMAVGYDGRVVTFLKKYIKPKENGPNKSGGRPDQALLDEINRRVLADRIISALEPTARPAARERENLERQAWENSHHSLSSNA